MNSKGASQPIKRLIGQYTQRKAGPLFIILGGIHGNEYSGIEALTRVFAKLKRLKPTFNGFFAGIAGNIKALQQGVRFLEKDLNRQWFPENIARIERAKKHELTSPEDIEQKELLTRYHYIRSRNNLQHTDYVMLDLHTTSARGGTYTIAPSHNKSKEIALALHLPVIIGLEKVINGTTLHYFSEQDMASFCLEAGQHQNPASADRMEAAIWITLCTIGCMKAEDIPNFEKYEALLKERGRGLPRMVKFRYRHAITEKDQFVMRLGYKNFQAIKEGEHLADDVKGKVLSPCDGLILMPLYQKQGEDGFFIVETVEVD